MLDRTRLSILALLVTACEAPRTPQAPEERPTEATVESAARAARPGPGWRIETNGGGAALSLGPAQGRFELRLSCRAVGGELRIDMPAFRPVASEERMSFGSGGEAEALVADSRGNAALGGVTARGATPAGLADLLSAPVSVSYGSQSSGPHPPIASEMSRAFAAACLGSRPKTPARTARAQPSGACMMQGGERLSVTPLRAVGTEPFWSARVEGRCVTYSHPDDPEGSRVWTRYAPRAGGGVWSGTLGKQPFELMAVARAGCSDGMSDKAYPLSAALLVGGERRAGCAEALPAAPARGP